MTELADAPRPASAPTPVSSAGAPAPAPRFLADIYQAASECNKCSLCQAVCPTYVTNPVEWETARGRVGLVRDAIEGRLELRDIAEGPLSTCLTCGNCVAACAPGVPTPEIVSRARQELHAQEGHPWAQTVALRSVLPHRGALRMLHRLSRTAQRTGLHALARRTGLTRWMGAAGALADHVGPLDARTAYHRARDLPAVDGRPRARVGFLVCCYENLAAPEAAEATMRVLVANGFDVVVPELACSGLPAFSMGDRDAMVDMAVRTSDRLRDVAVDWFVGSTASCSQHYQRYAGIVGDDRQLGATARRISQRTLQASTFLDREGMTATLGRLRWHVTYDEPCQLPLDVTVRSAPYRLLEAVPGLRLTRLEEAAMCCGGAGTYFHTQAERSDAILQRKFEHVRATGADVLVTENVSCLMQLREGARRHAPEVRVMHLFEVLQASLDAARRLQHVVPRG